MEKVKVSVEGVDEVMRKYANLMIDSRRVYSRK